jgi:hypothetical protein
MLFREHREYLEDSMETLFRYDNHAQLIDHLQSFDDFQRRRSDGSIVNLPVKITIKLYSDEPDKRIGWNKTYIVEDKEGVIGFTDSPYVEDGTVEGLK